MLLKRFEECLSAWNYAFLLAAKLVQFWAPGTLAFVGLEMYPSELSPGLVPNFLDVWEAREHVGERNRLPSSACLEAKEYAPNDRDQRETTPPLHFGRFVIEGTLAHDLVECFLNGILKGSAYLAPRNPTMSRIMEVGRRHCRLFARSVHI